MGDTFKIFFLVQMIWHKLLWKARGMLKMPMRKKNYLFWNARRRLKVWKFVFFMFSSKRQGNKYVQNILFAPFSAFDYGF
jgi:hypothetical protein